MKVLDKLKNVPKKPGVYLWKDQDNNVIYIGKAKNLFNRMHQYFQGSINSYKTNSMVEQINDFEIFETASERDAFQLEKKLIKKYAPRYNIKLKDGRNNIYLHVKIDRNNMLIIEQTYALGWNNDSNYYFGPLTTNLKPKLLISTLQRFFTYRNGLKIEKFSPKEARDKFNEIVDILNLKTNKFVNKLIEIRDDLASFEKQQYELAKEYRDVIEVFKNIKETQIVELSNFKNIDAFSFKFYDDVLSIQVLRYHFGALLHSFNQIMLWDSTQSKQWTIDNCLSGFYLENNLPNNIIINSEYENYDWDASFFHKMFIFPKKGKNKTIIDLADDNNENNFKLNGTRLIASLRQTKETQLRLNYTLNQGNKINHIYMFDNSHTGNNYLTGVAICYKDFSEYFNHFRKFNHEEFIDEIKHSDDHYMFLTISRFLEENPNITNNLNSNDIFIVDGAKRQINACLKALEKHNINNVKVYGLVKNQHHKTRNLLDSNGVVIPITQLEYDFFSGMQERVDAYAKNNMRLKYVAGTTKSVLQNIPGIGKETEKKLLNHFESFNKIFTADITEINEVIGAKKAKILKEFLNNFEK
ncbi:excinuclease ABC subunit C [Mycoplasma sp. Pen4]|uniref:excinuclease ABC subunit UvrC n=1 Tax=Mycoplasma sp. Pen4 TaxID=640330 RepID=UPI0016549306|nr:excinuclease ABC subunit UvrC [Mycoplasma sp. Pen4]QNM93796.1 excinuclease ABC subunit C [Mycoplasma sp. Pen4]